MLKKYFAWYLLLLIFFSSNDLFTSKYYLSMCAIFKNEAQYLKEWIEFHQLAGVEHFYLLNNRSTDDYQKVLEPYVKRGIVNLYQWNYTLEDFKNWAQMQRTAYNKIIQKHKFDTTWLAIIDIDEFLFPTKKNNLKEFLKDYEEFGGVCANWVMFGTNNVNKIPQNKLLIESLISRAKKNHPRQKYVKSIVQPRYVKYYHVHHGKFYDKKHFIVTENKERIHKARSPYFSVNKIRVNHYWTRDENFFNNTKIPRAREMKMRGTPEMKRILQWKREFNKEKDFAISRFVKPLKKLMSNL